MLTAGEAALMLGFSADRRGWARRHKLELAVVMIIGTGFVALLTAAAAQRFLANEIRRDVPTAVGDPELSEADILAELRRVREQLDRGSAQRSSDAASDPRRDL